MTKISNQYSLTNILTADLANSRLGINNTNPSYSLDLTGDAKVGGSLIVTGNLTAQQFIVSSSVTYLTESFASGSHKFGDSSDDNHNFTGSLIVSGSANPLRVGSNLLFVSSSGNVGVGTTTPSYTLDVTGTARVSGAATFSSSVGVGVTPNSLVTIGKTVEVGFAGSAVWGAGQNQTYLSSNYYYASGDKFAGTGYAQTIGLSNGAVYFQTSTASGTLGAAATLNTNMFISIGGNVGINTTSPDQKLVINQGATSTGQGIPATTGTTQNGILRLRPAIALYGETLDFGMNVATTYGWIQATNANNLATNYNLALNPNGGNVGIGTTSPLQTTTNRTVLTVNGTNQAIINLGYGGNLAAYLYSDNNNYTELYSYGQLNFVAAGSQPMTFTTTGGERMRITPSFPTILVGTSTNTWGEAGRATLELSGSANSLVGFLSAGIQKGYIYNNGTDIIGQLNSGGAWQFKSSGGGVQLTFNSTAWASISDERLKNINSYIDNAVNKLNTLRTINYSWKSDNTKQEFLGLIAQDVDKVFPEVIEKNKKPENIGEVKDETEYLSVKYTELVPVLIKAIQELSAENTSLINRIEALENK